MLIAQRVFKIFIAFFILFSFFLIALRNIDPDLGWHLKEGEWILSNKAVPYFDRYSYTMPGFGWVNHEWLLDAWFWWMHVNNLWWLVSAIFSILAFIPVLFWIKHSKSLSGLWLTLLISFLLLGFIGIRPQVVSFLFFFIVFEILFGKYYRKVSKFQKAGYLFLPVIFFIWANLHAGFFSGLVLFGFYIFINFLWSWRVKHRINIPELKSHLILFFLSCGATLINPYSWKLYREVFTVAFSSDSAKYIVEWQSAFVFAGSLSSFPLPLFLGLFFFLFFKFWKKYPLQISATVFLFSVLFLKSMKMGPLFFVTAMPLLSSGFQKAKEEIATAQAKQPFSLVSLKLLKVGIILAFILLFGFLSFKIVEYNKPNSFYPVKAVEFLRGRLKEKEISNINILNNYGWGGYLIWKLPELKVFIDGRMPHWIDENGNSAMKDYTKVFYSKENDNWEEVFERRKINMVMIWNDKETEDSRMVGWLANRLGFLRNYLQNHKDSIFVKKLIDFLGINTKNLKAKLLENGWDIVYQDEIAVILRPRNY